MTIAIGYALVMGLRAAPLLRTLADQTPLALFDLKPRVPDKPEQPRRDEPPAPRQEEGGEAPSGRPRIKQAGRSPPLPQSPSPTPAIIMPQPLSPVISAPAGGEAGSPNGLSVAGGGSGDGQGSGSGGQGVGNGRGDGGSFSRARQVGGRFRNSDFPPSARGSGRLTIGVRYAIAPTGRVDKCDIIETSGYAEVDAMTCRIIMERYRFRPARDPDGYAVTEVREEDYRWRVH